MIRIVRELKEEYRDVIPQRDIYSLPKKLYTLKIYVFGIRVWYSSFDSDVTSSKYLQDMEEPRKAGFK